MADSSARGRYSGIAGIAGPSRRSWISTSPDTPDPDPSRRFSDRVEDYVRHRPSYPIAVIRFLGTETGLAQTCDVADVGSGTGIFTRLLLDTGATAFAVEPNDLMRGAGEAELRARGTSGA